MSFRYDTYEKRVTYACIRCEKEVMLSYCQKCWRMCINCELYYYKEEVNDLGYCDECDGYRKETERLLAERAPPDVKEPEC